MTRAERKAAEAAYTALMKRVRKLSAGLSRQAIRQVDAVVADVRAGLGREASSATLSQAKAEALLRKMSAGLDRIEQQWLRSARQVTSTIITRIVDEHRTVHMTVAKVVNAKTGGISMKLGVVPSKTAKAVAASLRGKETISQVIRKNMRSVERGMKTYVRGAVDEVPSDAALAGMRRLLNGELPFQLGTSTKAEVTEGASLEWKIERLLKTEAIETYRQANAQALKAGPVQMVAEWVLSEHHVIEDACDDVAGADVGFGPGWYPPEEWPDAPHPNCTCGQGDIRIVSSGNEEG